MNTRIVNYLGLVIAFAGLLSLQSCKNPCKDVVCENGGICNEDNDGVCDCEDTFYGTLCETECVNGTYGDGTCACDDYYEGDACKIEERIKFYGAYDVDEECDINYTYASTIKSTTGNVYKIEISYLYRGDWENPIIAEVNGHNITIPSQQPEDGFTMSGSGIMTDDGSELVINYTLDDSSIGTVSCEAIFTRQ
ncbi:MAG: hypothetical protein RLP15_07875 [Cryomorphaceae bacterium]